MPRSIARSLARPATPWLGRALVEACGASAWRRASKSAMPASIPVGRRLRSIDDQHADRDQHHGQDQELHARDLLVALRLAADRVGAPTGRMGCSAAGPVRSVGPVLTLPDRGASPSGCRCRTAPPRRPRPRCGDETTTATDGSESASSPVRCSSAIRSTSGHRRRASAAISAEHALGPPPRRPRSRARRPRRARRSGRGRRRGSSRPRPTAGVVAHATAASSGSGVASSAIQSAPVGGDQPRRHCRDGFRICSEPRPESASGPRAPAAGAARSAAVLRADRVGTLRAHGPRGGRGRGRERPAAASPRSALGPPERAVRQRGRPPPTPVPAPTRIRRPGPRPGRRGRRDRRPRHGRGPRGWPGSSATRRTPVDRRPGDRPARRAGQRRAPGRRREPQRRRDPRRRPPAGVRRISGVCVAQRPGHHERRARSTARPRSPSSAPTARRAPASVVGQRPTDPARARSAWTAARTRRSSRRTATSRSGSGSSRSAARDGSGPWVATGVVASLGGWAEDGSGSPTAGMITVDAVMPPEAQRRRAARPQRSRGRDPRRRDQATRWAALATPIATVRDVAAQLAATGKADHGSLGVRTADERPTAAGRRSSRVAEGSAAATAPASTPTTSSSRLDGRADPQRRRSRGRGPAAPARASGCR